MLYSNDSEGNRCFHPYIIDFMQHARHDKLSLVLRGVDIKNAVDHSGSTLLHLSAGFGTRYLTTFFIKVSKVDVDAKNNFGETPLMLATRSMNFEQVELLLNFGADICIKDNKGTSALMIVEYFRNVAALVELFVDHVEKICKTNTEIADLLIRAGCEVPYRFDAFRNAEITRIMLERGCAVNARDKQHNGNTPLHAAVEKNDVESVKVLLRFGADKLIRNRSDSVPFVHALNREQTDFEILELLLPEDVDWTQRNDRSEKMKLRPIFVSASKRILEMFLRRCSVNLKAKDDHGQTPIHYLVENEHDGVWDLFEDADLDVNARDNAGSTALHLAGTLVNASAVQFLLDKGADANALNDTGRSPLLNVFVNGGILNFEAEKYHECIELLLHYGADNQLIDRNRESLISHSTSFQSYDLHVPILAHLALLEATGAPINHFVKNPIMIDPKLRRLYESCKRELEDLKKTKLYGDLTYFQLLTEEYQKIATYAQIQDILYMILCGKYTESYYVRLLRRRLLKAKMTMVHSRKQQIEVVTGNMYSTSLADVDRSTSRFDCKDLDLRFAQCCALETMCE